jgi:hypothetical protein
MPLCLQASALPRPAWGGASRGGACTSSRRHHQNRVVVPPQQRAIELDFDSSSAFPSAIVSPPHGAGELGGAGVPVEDAPQAWHSRGFVNNEGRVYSETFPVRFDEVWGAPHGECSWTHTSLESATWFQPLIDETIA